MTAIMHGFRATSGRASCTVSVQGTDSKHAPKPCMLDRHCDLRHARLGVQHNRPHLAPQPCNLPCTPVGATQDNLYRTTKPVMHYVQDGRVSTATNRVQPLTYRTTNATTDRARRNEYPDA